ncbi:FecR domain-containing protein [Chitinophaga pendula]|uniref:FecR family protein n=1 Tax=Chitinophaga TaxID=79328 RepID=UPI000BB04DEF|nr:MULTISPECIES: FecR domain-containing protein [Chitinophaga]ASZ12141.1 hypothetical protein CK934_14825 [Chitinophaga sp. MD30]UCJ04818.1 FecR domain-containing protein [Chitinophaga pendula]
MNIQDFSNIIDRYLEGNASPEEIAFIQKWVMLQRNEEIMLNDTDRRRIKGDMWAFVGHETGTVAPRRLRITYLLLRCAAILVAVVAGVALFMLVQHSRRQANMIQMADRRVETPPGVMKKVRLIDGSIVYLFPGSAVQIPADYDEKQRLVRVTGRAFFEVEGNSTKAFRVETGQLSTTVLGTSFEVQQQGPNAVVAVRTGKVRVQYGSRHLSDVEAGGRLIYDTVKADLRSEKISGIESFNWTSGTLSFHQVPLSEVCKMISDWFNIKIVIRQQQLVGRKVTINLSGQSMETAMQILTQTVGCSYQKEGEYIIIY